eukprot:g4402.t1
MVFTPLNTPIHANPRSRRQSTSSPPIPTAAIPTPSPPTRRIKSPTPDEASTPTAENIQTHFNNTVRRFSSSTDFGDKVVEDVSEGEAEESFLLDQDMLTAALCPVDQESAGLSWTGWLGVAIVGVIGLGAVIIARRAEDDDTNKSRDLKYHLG